MKQCSNCKEFKELNAYSKRMASHDGLNASCKACRSARRKASVTEKEYDKKRYHANKESEKARVKKWYDANPGKKAEHRRTSRLNNLASIRQKEAEKNARRRTRVPSWLTQEQKEQIAFVYSMRDEAKLLTGDDYHVDHIVPLVGENICGLHVPWNLQVLPACVNLSKGNRTDGPPQASGEQP